MTDISRAFRASFDGECFACFDDILEGDTMYMSEGNPLCEDCGDEILNP